MEAKLADVNTVNKNLALAQLTKSEQSLKYGRLTRTRSSNDSNFHKWLHCKREIPNTRLKALSILHGDLVKLNLTLLRPVCFGMYLIGFLNNIIFTF